MSLEMSLLLINCLLFLERNPHMKIFYKCYYAISSSNLEKNLLHSLDTTPVNVKIRGMRETFSTSTIILLFYNYPFSFL